MAIDAFLVTRQWRDTARGIEIVYWLASDEGPLRVVVAGQEAVFFVRARDVADAEQVLRGIPGWRHAPVQLRAFDKEPVHAFYFRGQRQLRAAREALHKRDLEALEADIRSPERHLMERFLTGPVRVHGQTNSRVRGKCPFRELHNPRMRAADYRPVLRSVSLDIETSMRGDALYSVALYASDASIVLLARDGEDAGEVRYLGDEAAVLQGLLDWIAHYDPDAIIGWNVVDFDLRVLQRKCDEHRMAFTPGRGAAPAEWRRSASTDQRLFVLVPGRAVFDGIELLRAATYRFESFALDYVARELLGRGKKIDDVDDRGAQIERLFRSDPVALAAYNLEDCRLVAEIFAHTDLTAFALERARLTGLPLDRAGGSVAAFDNLYLPRLHRSGYVAPNAGSRGEGQESPGGYVMDSCPGLYRHVLVLDFKSLYPSIIRTFHVDPLALVEAQDALSDNVLPGYRGAAFSRDHHLLPGILAQLWEARDQAKRDGNQPLSRAIKIIMNSFYGVLGSPGCRFHDARLASSITMRGHDIIRRSRVLIEDFGYKVIYGDTDSLFVWLEGDHDDVGVGRVSAQLATYLNDWWRAHLSREHGVESFLEIELDAHYAHFLMPTMRGSARGSKKRYAGLLREPDGAGGWRDRLVFRGLESVRTDWTRLAREVQQALYLRVFRGEPFEEYVREVAGEVLAGRRDDDLLYRKRLRRGVGEYQRNVPPHAQAAAKVDRIRAGQGLPTCYDRGGWIEYYITTAGPESARYRTSPLDYEHYLARQLAPVVDGIAGFLDTSFDEILQRQLGLFTNSRA